MSEQIAPCPMPYCGAECRECISADGFGSVHCRLCDYRTGNREAHNALCADVELGRGVRRIMAERRHIFVKESPEPDEPVLRFMAESVAADWRDSTIDHYDVANGDTLDAALAALAKRISEGGKDGTTD